MNSQLVEEQLSAVEEFLEALEEEPDSSHGSEYRHIHGLIRFAQRFYEDFLRSAFGIEITSFSFADKRVVAERIDEEEGAGGDASPDDDRDAVQLNLAYRYLELCDQLHEDVLFGYSEDAADYVDFHEETFPDWLGELAALLKSRGEEDLSGRIADLIERYRLAT